MNKLIFHVGLMKSGTTYIQEILSRNRDQLVGENWDYPGARLNQQHACYSICGNDIPWVKKAFPKELGEDLVAKVKSSSNSVLISSEALSVLHNDGIDRFIKRIGTPEKIVFTIRSLDKTLPSAWQQYLKGGGRTTFSAFIERLREQREDLSGFWRTYGFGHAIERWSQFAEVDVVILPRKSETREELWHMFRAVAGLPQVDSLEVPEELANRSLALQAAQILRRLNKTLPKREERSDRIRNEYLKRAVFPNVGKIPGEKIEIPGKYLPLIKQWSNEEVSLLQGFSQNVRGSLNDLSIQEPSTDKVSSVMKNNLILQTAASQLISLIERE